VAAGCQSGFGLTCGHAGGSVARDNAYCGMFTTRIDGYGVQTLPRRVDQS
jgi:hypothetical protein